MATKEFTNFSDLLAHVASGIEDALNNEVQNDIKQKISKSAQEHVILETPGRDAGGIDDITQMQGEVTPGKTVFKLKVKDVAKPDDSVFGQPFDTSKDAAVGGTMFTNWIEDGTWIDIKELLNYRRGIGWNPAEHEHWSEYKTERGMPKAEWSFKPRREPRPFISIVQEEIEQDPQYILNAIEKSILK